MSYIIIHCTMQSRHVKTMKNVSKTICKDGYALLTFSDPKQTEQTFAAMKKAGKNCNIKEDGENKVIVQYWEGKTAHQIADYFEQDVKNMQEKYSKLMKINYSRAVF